jgi:hypothetical protein
LLDETKANDLAKPWKLGIAKLKAAKLRKIQEHERGKRDVSDEVSSSNEVSPKTPTLKKPVSQMLHKKFEQMMEDDEDVEEESTKSEGRHLKQNKRGKTIVMTTNGLKTDCSRFPT